MTMTTRKRKRQGDLCFIPIDDDHLKSKDVSEAEACTVCFVNRRTCAVVHGATAHMCMCTRCANTVLKQKSEPTCPICKQPIEKAVRVFT
jgi:hypothetical protein